MSEQVKIPLPRSLQEIVGALLFASQDPLSASELRDAVRAVEPEEGENAEVMDVYKTCTSREIDEAIKGLGKALEVAGCGFRLVCTGGTYRLQTVPSCGRYVRAMLKLDRPSRLGRASLETLAIIAYRQPITKSEIEDIRGVDVTANIKTLMDLQLIRLVGRSELPGHPFLYGTTQIFLDHFGISSLQQLNELDPTLQRSNPRLKAEQYKRVEKKTELEKAAEEAAKDEGVVEGEGEGKGEGEGEGKGEGVGEGIVEGEGVGEGKSEGEGEAVDKGAPAEDDDFFIDDTPDEFDDDDDEDEDEEDIDEEDENEDDDE
jgi:segregation and condensation protein B